MLGDKIIIWNFSSLELKVNRSKYEVLNLDQLNVINMAPSAIVVKDVELTKDYEDYISSLIDAMNKVSERLAAIGLTLKDVKVVKTLDGVYFHAIESGKKEKHSAKSRVTTI